MLIYFILEFNGFVICMLVGLILYIGDWKIDFDLLIGEEIDSVVLEVMGEEGVFVMVCDSINVFLAGESGFEVGVKDVLIEVVGEFKGKVVIVVFVFNVVCL